MDIKAYIASGNLELYVAGLLSEKENLEVYELALANEEVLSEIIAIEAAVLALTKTTSPGLPHGFDIVKEKINIDKESKVVDLKEKDINWSWYVGWAASLALAIGLFYLYTQNQDLQSQIEMVNQENQQLEQQIADSDASLEKSQELLNTIRDKNITVVPLGGQAVSPTSYAKAYWNKEEQKVFIDAKGLPEPPEGMVYQVWSLKLSPLTPTSLGLLDNFEADDNKVFALFNTNESEAFGITLEPAGGSESPNLEQLYTLGAVSAS
ncbi:anti-sigma factor [Aggregatimonas sangjinii]|uniref:Anti-sigma factor n=1 Tax=Aggregatimonas sangjinii TaxID=2583587 RepID=A0A5B7STU1_9FLAO|nr:anti-sigma factor [Aggregatimonas sangjinii]QCX00428.1 anti-sigma factor [Aggregatimonas sangjinii]